MIPYLVCMRMTRAAGKLDRVKFRIWVIAVQISRSTYLLTLTLNLEITQTEYQEAV